jgi:hypothetical protein
MWWYCCFVESDLKRMWKQSGDGTRILYEVVRLGLVLVEELALET